MNDIAPPPPPTAFARLRDALDLRLNPMLLKDLRLWMRTKKFLGLFFFVVAASVVTASFYVVLARAHHFDGRAMWAILCGSLGVIAFAVVPYFVFERFRLELANGATDLVLLSALRPEQLVFGKLMSAWCVSLLCAAALTPMLVTAYMLGGIDFHITLLTLAALLLGTLCMPMFQLYVATMGQRTRTLRGLALLLTFGQAVMAISGANFIYFTMSFGHGLDRGSWLVLLNMGVPLLLFAHFLFRLTVTPLCSAHLNRDAGPRAALMLYLFGSLVVGLVAAGLSNHGPDFGEALGMIVLALTTGLGLGVLFLSGTSELVSRRLLGIWRNRPLLRLLFFPGIRRLTAFFLFNAALLYALLALSQILQHGARYRAGSYAMAATGLLSTVGVGLATHIHLTMRLRRKGPPIAAPVTILAVNILLGVQALAAYIFHSAGILSRNALTISLGLCPSSVFVNAFNRSPESVSVCHIGMVFAIIVGLLLVRAVILIPRIPEPPPPTEAPNEASAEAEKA